MARANSNKEANKEPVKGETKDPIKGETSAADLSAESLTGGKDADTTAVAIRSNVLVVKQPGKDEYGNPIAAKSKLVEIEKGGKTLEVSQKAFEIIYAGHGYKLKNKNDKS